ncbi:unnamed protein product, partial [Didymodactylos carnosus]
MLSGRIRFGLSCCRVGSGAGRHFGGRVMFLSTTTNRDLALIFAGAGTHSIDDDIQSMLFEIQLLNFVDD